MLVAAGRQLVGRSQRFIHLLSEFSIIFLVVKWDGASGWATIPVCLRREFLRKWYSYDLNWGRPRQTRTGGHPRGQAHTLCMVSVLCLMCTKSAIAKALCHEAMQDTGKGHLTQIQGGLLSSTRGHFLYDYMTLGHNLKTSITFGLSIWKMRIIPHQVLKSRSSQKLPMNYFEFTSVTQSCLTLCDPLNCNTPAPCPSPTTKSTQTHVHQVGDAILPSHPLLSPSPPALNLSQRQGFFQ